MAGSLILSEKGWLGHKETVLYSGEGPIWTTEWRGTLIAWASDAVRLFPLSRSLSGVLISAFLYDRVFGYTILLRLNG